ncbi:hypothetical protein AB1K89_08495 [Sporosarcina sp. 179-K 8C2 HS]|uniref:hypothetical protein n=1 Tax=Sporosarcina sp. 179-K 8C2 HS TaxID=3142387 RepID=UPI0039A1FF0C
MGAEPGTLDARRMVLDVEPDTLDARRMTLDAIVKLAQFNYFGYVKQAHCITGGIIPIQRGYDNY